MRLKWLFYLILLFFDVFADDMLVEIEKYREIGDGLDLAFVELYGF